MQNSKPKLIKIATAGEDESQRREALIELGYQPDPDIYPTLVEQLKDSSASIRHAAIISLGRYGNPAAVDELIKSKFIQSPILNIRWAVVSALGKLGDYHVIEHLVRAVKDPEWIIRNQAVTELKGKIRELLEMHEHRNVHILIRLLALEDEEIVDLAVSGLSECGIESLDRILEAAKSHSVAIRANAARVLGLMRSDQAVDTLVELLHDSDWRVRRRAIEALGLIKNKKVIEPLVRFLADNVEKVQREAIRALVGFGKLSTNSLLGALAHEKNKFVLRAIIRTLGEIADPKAIPDLVIHLRSSYFVVRVAAVRALIKYGAQVVDQLSPTLSYNESDISDLLEDAGSAEHPLLQLRAIKALGGLEDHRAVALLKKLVDEGIEEVQEAAATALSQVGCAAWGRCGALIVLKKVGNPLLIPDFIYSLKDDSDNVRLEAVRALAEIPDSKSVNALIDPAREDRDPYIRFEAIRHLRRIGVGYPQVLDLALEALKDPSREVRSQAVWLLGNFQDERSIAPLLKATADAHWSVRESAENALLNFGQKAVPQLLEALEHRTWMTRLRVARILGEIKDQRALEPLSKLACKKGERKEVRQVANSALKKIKGI